MPYGVYLIINTDMSMRKFYEVMRHTRIEVVFYHNLTGFLPILSYYCPPPFFLPTATEVGVGILQMPPSVLLKMFWHEGSKYEYLQWSLRWMEEIEQIALEEKYYSTKRVKRGFWCFSFVYAIAWVKWFWFEKCFTWGQQFIWISSMSSALGKFLAILVNVLQWKTLRLINF